MQFDASVVRGLAYYTGVVFEAFDRKGEFRAIAGGGRYDNLVRSLSGGRADMPAIGFGMGDVVLALLLKERGRLPSFASTVDVVVLLEDESLRPESLGVVQRLRDRGLAVDYSLVPMKGDKQFRRALEVGAGHTVRLDRDAGGLVARVKNLKTRAEQVIAVDDVAGHAFD